MNKDTVGQVFDYLSKGVMVLAFLILVVGVVSRLNMDQKTKENYLPPSPKVIANSNLTKQSSSSARIFSEILNLNGSFICQSSGSAGFKFFIKDKKVFGQTTNKTVVKNYILNGDCLYLWQSSFTVGKKVCSLGEYLSILSSLSQLGLGNLNITDFLKSIGNVGNSSAKIEEIAETCKKEKIKDVSVFNLPKNITFQEVKLEEIMK